MVDLRRDLWKTQARALLCRVLCIVESPSAANSGPNTGRRTRRDTQCTCPKHRSCPFCSHHAPRPRLLKARWREHQTWFTQSPPFPNRHLCSRPGSLPKKHCTVWLRKWTWGERALHIGINLSFRFRLHLLREHGLIRHTVHLILYLFTLYQFPKCTFLPPSLRSRRLPPSGFPRPLYSPKVPLAYPILFSALT